MKNYLFVFVLLAMFSCADPEEETPACIETDLITFQTVAACVGDNLASWDFQGDKVYCFAYGTCTSVGEAEIFDGECNLVCILGGIDGLTTCNGVPWLQNATNEQTIWTKEN